MDLIDVDSLPISFENFRIPETSLENAEFIAFKLDDRLFNARTALSASADNCIFKLSTVPSATIPPPNFFEASDYLLFDSRKKDEKAMTPFRPAEISLIC